MTTATPRFKIGELAKQSNVSIKTIRYYEELGLLPALERSSGGFRIFAETSLARLDFIKRAQRLGLSLQEIGHLLQIYDHGDRPCEEVTQALRTKISAIDQHIADLQELKQQLQQLVLDSGELTELPSGVICPIIQLQS